jgi:purine catabolism regulator
VLRALLPPDTATGVSDHIESAARVPEAGQEARWALGVAEAESRDLVRYSEQTALLLPRAPVEARALVTRVLGALITYDAEHGTDYLRTLRAMLRHNRSWRLAAQELHIHKQTLGYRLRKIEQLTGRGFTKTEHLAELWFAVRANDLVEGRSPPR